MVKSDANSEFEIVLNALRRQYIQSLPEQQWEVRSRWQQLNQDHWDRAAAGKFLHIVHKLSGTAGSYGLSEVSEIARALELSLDRMPADRQVSWNEQRAQLSGMTEQLCAALDAYAKL